MLLYKPVSGHSLLYSSDTVLRMMSPVTRKRHRTGANITSTPMTTTNVSDKVERAKEAVGSLDHSKDSWERFREVWQELRQAYEDSVKNPNSDTRRPFPIWALSQFDPGRLERLLTTGYHQDLGQLRAWAPSASLTFNVGPWQFVLFFGRIEQARARAIGKIARARPSLTIARLYEEVESNRLHRIGSKRSSRYEFQPSDFKACCL